MISSDMTKIVKAICPLTTHRDTVVRTVVVTELAVENGWNITNNTLGGRVILACMTPK